MTFIQPCFIRKNTPELRAKLEDLGYINGAWETPHLEYPYLTVWPNSKFGLFKGEGFYMTEDDYRLDGKVWEYKPKEGVIDCGDNEELFLALAALRDDNDINQWFIHNSMDCIVEKLRTIDWFICDENRIEDFACYDSLYLNCHKATVEELIEHFKKE